MFPGNFSLGVCVPGIPKCPVAGPPSPRDLAYLTPATSKDREGHVRELVREEGFTHTQFGIQQC